MKERGSQCPINSVTGRAGVGQSHHLAQEDRRGRGKEMGAGLDRAEVEGKEDLER